MKETTHPLLCTALGEMVDGALSSLHAEACGEALATWVHLCLEKSDNT